MLSFFRRADETAEVLTGNQLKGCPQQQEAGVASRPVQIPYSTRRLRFGVLTSESRVLMGSQIQPNNAEKEGGPGLLWAVR